MNCSTSSTIQKAVAMLVLVGAIVSASSLAQDVAAKPQADIRQRIASGRFTRIVCFGDSITGAYYHTGGQRAWCDMLGLALQKANPRASLQMINAGISGHTTVNGLARIERDVIAKNPHVVVVMFGMNDVTRVPLEAFESNIREIVQRCQKAGAAVVLCTPNAVSANAARPEEKLAKYAEVVRSIADDLTLPLVDCFSDWQTFRTADPTAWSLVMSDEIHPNMNGHARFAELIAEKISGREVSLNGTPPSFDSLHHTFDRLLKKQPVRLIAMPPYDQLIPEQLRKHFPDASFEVTVWPTENQPIAEMTEWAKRIRGLKPDLVVPAIPQHSLSTAQQNFIPAYEWILNFSFEFAGRPWDVVPILPLDSNARDALHDNNLKHARRIAVGKDVRFAERMAGDERTPAEILDAWISDQKQAWMANRNHLPDQNGSVLVAAQSWPHRPGPRCARVSVYFPGGQRKNVSEKTGIMLTLHNWGGEDCVGTASPNALVDRLNVIAVCVNYLQSGRIDSIDSPEPYDCGYLQALDALRALAYVRSSLKQSGQPYDDGRIFCTGGSGGGNVTLMANKLAPRTFTCIVDMCGMKKLSDDIAFNLPGGTGLNARWSQESDSLNHLSPDEQAIRFVGDPQHLKVMKQLHATGRIIVVHGRDDTTCPFADAQELVTNLEAAGLDVESHYIGSDDLDGTVFTSSGHALGNRTEIVFTVAEKYLRADSPDARRREGLTDFDRRENIEYPTENGRFVISYADGLPEATFVPAEK